jgi:hypothetical protein
MGIFEAGGLIPYTRKRLGIGGYEPSVGGYEPSVGGQESSKEQPETGS